jgi:hypothetical protein
MKKTKVKKMQSGGMLKPVDSSKNPGLAKLPTEVRNKMGYMKNGGKAKPGTKEQRSAIAKKAIKGKDMGKPGKGFEKIAEKAAKKYGSKEAGKKVAGAMFWKTMTKKK